MTKLVRTLKSKTHTGTLLILAVRSCHHEIGGHVWRTEGVRGQGRKKMGVRDGERRKRGGRREREVVSDGGREATLLTLLTLNIPKEYFPF